jgi:hypothetical protein
MILPYLDEAEFVNLMDLPTPERVTKPAMKNHFFKLIWR